MPVTLWRTSTVSESGRGEQQKCSPECAAIELLRHCITVNCESSWSATFRNLPRQWWYGRECNLHTHCLSITGCRGSCVVCSVIWASLWSLFVVYGRTSCSETGPLIDRWSGWLGGTFERCATDDCVIVSLDFGECVTSVKYNTFYVNFVVSLLDILSLVWISIHKKWTILNSFDQWMVALRRLDGL